jgi:Leucine-rich repeat (LRR) protein
MLKISNMKNMNRLKSFSFGLAKIDIEGIDRFTSLEFISLENCEPYNINSIGNLKNLKSLSINLISDNPSLEFLKNMPNLRFVCFYGNLHLYRDTLFENEPSQVLDVTPLATLKELKDIICTNFIIKNIPALDVLDIPDYIDLEHSILYDETEESRHWLKFIRGDR